MGAKGFAIDVRKKCSGFLSDWMPLFRESPLLRDENGSKETSGCQVLALGLARSGSDLLIPGTLPLSRGCV